MHLYFSVVVIFSQIWEIKGAQWKVQQLWMLTGSAVSIHVDEHRPSASICCPCWPVEKCSLFMLNSRKVQPVNVWWIYVMEKLRARPKHAYFCFLFCVDKKMISVEYNFSCLIKFLFPNKETESHWEVYVYLTQMSAKFQRVDV